MSDSPQSQQPAEAGSSTPIGITRAGKACEPCRVRKTRCNIARQEICSECIKRDIAAQCKIREKARPNRYVSPSVGAGRGSKLIIRPVSQRLRNAPAGSQSHQPPVSAGGGVPSWTPTPGGVGSYGGSIRTGGNSGSEAGPSRLGWTPTPARGHPPLHTPNLDPSLQPVSAERSGAAVPTGQTSATVMVEAILLEQGRMRYGLDLDITMPPENIFKSRDSRYLSLAEMGLDPSLPGALAQAQGWINTHHRALHHSTPFLHLPQVLDIASRLFTPPFVTVANDELALLYAVLALGSLREQTYDPQTGLYRTLPSSQMTINDLLLGFGASPLPDEQPAAESAFQLGSIAQSLFRLAQEELEGIEQPSETAVQALFLLHMFVSSTSMGRRSRDYVARAVMMSHELGLNRRVSQDGDGGAARRRAMLYLYVYFSDVYLSALESHAPLIKRHDYDPDVFAPIYQAPTGEVDSSSGTPFSGLRDFVDLVSTIGAALERLHMGYHGLEGVPSVQLVLELDKEMDELRTRLAQATFGPDLRAGGGTAPDKRSAMAGSVLRQIHYNWSRIALRAPSLQHPLLRHSSMAICARSALSILQFHRHVIGAGLLNLPWMQLRRIATSIYIVFIALWAGEVTHADAEAAVGNTLNVLCVVGTRWKSATGLARTVVQLADASGLVFDRPQDQRQNTGAIAAVDNMGGLWEAIATQNGGAVGRQASQGAYQGDPNCDWTLGADGDLFADWQSLHQPPW